MYFVHGYCALYQFNSISLTIFVNKLEPPLLSTLGLLHPIVGIYFTCELLTFLQGLDGFFGASAVYMTHIFTAEHFLSMLQIP
jgi:hypothetical protein